MHFNNKISILGAAALTAVTFYATQGNAEAVTRFAFFTSCTKANLLDST